MKIGICVRTWGEKGGIGVYTRSVVREMIKVDRKNQYVLFYQHPSHMGNFEESENVKEILLRTSNKWFWDQWAVPMRAIREDIDIIFHTKFSIPFLSKCKTAMVLHGTERFVHPEFHQRADLIFFKTIYPQFLRRASLILAVSENARQDIIKFLGIDPEKVKTVHLAADPVFRVIQDTEKLDRLKNKYDLPDRFILYVGHIYPGKNIGRLFKAFRKVRDHHDINLVIAGSPRWKYEDDLNLLKELQLQNVVKMSGHVPAEDLTCFYNLAEITVFPSFYESFGIPNIEANGCGCPLITSKTGGSPEAAGDAAIYVNPLDVNDIAGAILRVLSDKNLKEDLIQKGFNNIKRFSWKETACKTLEVLESVCP